MCNFRDGKIKGSGKHRELGKTYSELACANWAKSNERSKGAVWNAESKICKAVMDTGTIDGAYKDWRSCYFDGIIFAMIENQYVMLWGNYTIN